MSPLALPVGALPANPENSAELPGAESAVPNPRSRSQILSRDERVKLGALLKARRTAARLSRAALGKQASLSVSTIKFIETARFAPSRASQLRLLAVPALRLSGADFPAPYHAGAEPIAMGVLAKVPVARLNCYLAPTADPVGMLAELGRVLRGGGGLVHPVSVYLDGLRWRWSGCAE